MSFDDIAKCESRASPSRLCFGGERYQMMHARVSRHEDTIRELSTNGSTHWRRHCGCLRTSEKLKQILKCFPSAPPPSPENKFDNTSIAAYYTQMGRTNMPMNEIPQQGSTQTVKKTVSWRSWQVVTDLVQIVQLSVTASALALYYLIYCYMQLVYYTLRSVLYFHNADGPMKITIGVVTITSLIVGFNLILKMERIIGILY